MPKESSKDGLEREEKDVLGKQRARENGLLEAAVYAHEEGSLTTGLWIGRLEDAESLNYTMRSLDRLHGYKALTERLHSQSLDRLSADAEPTDAEPRSYVQQKTP